MSANEFRTNSRGPLISRRGFVAAAAPLSASVFCRPALAFKSVADPVAALRDKLRGALHMPADPTYDEMRRGRGSTPVEDRFPAMVVLPETSDDISRTLDFAHSHKLEVSVRSGGHDVFGASTAGRGIVLDLLRMNAIRIDPAKGLAVTGAGVRAGELTLAAGKYGLTPVLGFHPNVGLGGLTLGGGIGWLCGTQGATVDHLASVDLVTADGRAIRADAEHNADLFWALRGGGGNFGVATAFTYRMPAVTHVLAGDVSYRADPIRFLRYVRDILAETPDALEILATITTGPEPICMLRVCWSGDIAVGEQAIRSLKTFAPAIAYRIAPIAYSEFATRAPAIRGSLLWRGGQLERLGDEAIEAIADATKTLRPGCNIGIQHYFHGALCRVPAASTPLIRNAGHVMYNITAYWTGDTRPTPQIEWVQTTAAKLRPFNSAGTYINYLSYPGEQPVRAAYGPHYARLQTIKRRYDPENVFRNNRNIRI